MINHHRNTAKPLDKPAMYIHNYIESLDSFILSSLLLIHNE